VNPLQRVPNPDMADYMDHGLNPETPHPYAIAEVRCSCTRWKQPPPPPPPYESEIFSVPVFSEA